MNVESNIKVTLTTEEKRTLAEARDILEDLFSTMEDRGCYSRDHYTVLAALSQYDGDEVMMYELEGIKNFLDIISMSDSLALEV